jgi:hypothetical protein
MIAGYYPGLCHGCNQPTMKNGELQGYESYENTEMMKLRIGFFKKYKVQGL